MGKATHDDEDAPAEEGPRSQCREVEPLSADNLLAELLDSRVLRAHLLVQAQPDGLDGDVLLAWVLAECTHDARREEAASANGDKEVWPVSTSSPRCKSVTGARGARQEDRDGFAQTVSTALGHLDQRHSRRATKQLT